MTNSSPCQYFPTCGGCDFLDLEEKKYRDLKKENLINLLNQNSFSSSNIDWIWIDPHSRRKIIFQIDHQNNLGFFTKKSNSLIKIDNCFVAEKEISNLIPKLQNFLQHQVSGIFNQVSATLFDSGLDLIFSIKKELDFLQISKLTNFAKAENINISTRFKNHLSPIFLSRKNQIFYNNFRIDLDSEVFIQATKFGLKNIVEICRNEIGLLNLSRDRSQDSQKKQKPSLKIADIYAGFGAYSFAIQDLALEITSFEGDENMVDSINKNAAKNNLSNKIKAETRDLFSNPLNKKELSKFDLAIINPPRNGASPQILEISKSSLKYIIYISCNPQSFLRDAKILIDSQFKIKKLTALDQFYSTKHLELISIFIK